MELLASLILGGLFDVAKGTYSRYQQRQEGKQQADYQLSLLDTEISAAKKDYAANILSGDAQFQADKTSALAKASLSVEGATNSYLQSMENSFLSGIEAESKYADTAAGFTQQIGGAVAAQGTAGVKDDIFTSVLRAEASRQLSEQRAAIDKTSAAAIQANKSNLSSAMKEAGILRDQYSAGGVASQLRALRQSTLEGQFSATTEKMDKNRTYLEDLSKQYDYNFDWFMADVFNIGSAGMGVFNQYERTTSGGN